VVKTIGAFMVAVVVYQFFVDVAKPVEPLFNEVIPQPQRGRASIIRNWMNKGMGFFINTVLIAQWDVEYAFEAAGRPIRFAGEHVVFWVGSVVLIIIAMTILFGVREREPLHPPERLSIRPVDFFKDIFWDRQSLMVYALWLAPWMTTIASNSFIPLFQTEQLGFSKAQLGGMAAIVMPVDIFIFTVIGGLLTDRMNRLRLLQLGVVLPGLVNLLLFLYVRYVAEYSISFATLVGFSLVHGFFLAWTYTVWGPVLYDYIPSNRMGTVSAGLSIVNGVLGFFLMNLGGLWVSFCTRTFGTRGGAPSDYSSVFVLAMILSFVALGLLVFFEREVKAGRVIAHASRELEEEKMRVAPDGG
jgi:hypothetical protein